MAKTKVRNHNEYFSDVRLGGRKSCPNCKVKHPEGGPYYWWFEYHNAKRYTVKHFCASCFKTEVRALLLGHAGECGCTIELCWRGCGERPSWLSLGGKSCSTKKTTVSSASGSRSSTAATMTT